MLVSSYYLYLLDHLDHVLRVSEIIEVEGYLSVNYGLGLWHQKVVIIRVVKPLLGSRDQVGLEKQRT